MTIYRAKSTQYYEVYSCHAPAGTFNVAVSNLRDPPDNLHVRDVKEWYVELLTNMLKDDSKDHEELNYCPALSDLLCDEGGI